MAHMYSTPVDHIFQREMFDQETNDQHMQMQAQAQAAAHLQAQTQAAQQTVQPSSPVIVTAANNKPSSKKMIGKIASYIFIIIAAISLFTLFENIIDEAVSKWRLTFKNEVGIRIVIILVILLIIWFSKL